MKKLLLVAGLLAIAGTADAGGRFSFSVIVNRSARVAQGDLGTARNSSDSNQYIDCATDVSTVSASMGICVAVDAAGQVGVCITQVPELIAQIRSIHDDSYVAFWWDVNANCTEVQVRNASYSQPRVP